MGNRRIILVVSFHIEVAMKKFKAVWKYVVGMMIFLPLWFVLLAVSFLASVSLFIFSLEWQLKSVMRDFGLHFNPFPNYSKMEKTLRKQVVEAWGVGRGSQN